MADDTKLRELALQFALAIADICDDEAFCECDVSEATTQVIDSANRVLAWLDPVAKLVLNVGPVTEQS
jgi:hypothetical protein